MHIGFIDTTLRDGAQSLWASGMRTGMIEAVAAHMNRAGFEVIEVPVTGTHFKKFVRDLKEDPWEMARMIARTMPAAVKSFVTGGVLHPFELTPPREVVELFFTRLVDTGALNRAQMTCNTTGQLKRTFPWLVPFYRNLGVQVAIALSYTISPRHTDHYYVQTTREALAFRPDAIYLKDQGGLLTLDRARTLLPAILANAGGVPVELHSHCTTGAAPVVYLEALRLGVRRLHTAIPPLAYASSQPSVFNVARNARLLGYETRLDENRLAAVSERLSAIARQEGLPAGAPIEYDHAQYVHQVPGGVISNLRHQLAQTGIAHRLAEVLEESVQVRKDMGYPIMITPHSQFVCTQAAINVATGKRYRHVLDELILFAQGIYGEDSGYTWMDQNLKDRLLAMPRAAELAGQRSADVPLGEIRARLGGPGVSDEEFLLRYLMKGSREIEAMRESMRAGGGPRKYYDSRTPLLALLQELAKRKTIGYVRLKRGGDSLLARAAAGAAANPS